MTPTHVYGRYALYEALGRGGAASVYLGVARGDELAPLAVKVLHESASREAGAVTRLLDEVRLSRQIASPNVVRVVDFVSGGEQVLAVMEYVHGEPLSRLLADARRLGQTVPIPVAAAIMGDVLRGLHAAHEARGSDGSSLDLVHRDATPENMLVGADGVTRITDFGVAKAQGRLQMTRDGGLRGKIMYSAPEQIGGEVTRRTDIYAAGLVLWEILVSERPIQGDNEAAILTKALDPQIPPPSTRAAAPVSPQLDDVVMRALAVDPEARFATALEMSEALAAAVGTVASAAEVGAWVEGMAGDRLAKREAAILGMLEAERPHARGHDPASARGNGGAVEGRATAERPKREASSRAQGLFILFAACALVLLVWYARTRGEKQPDVIAAVESGTASPERAIASTSSSASASASATATASASASVTTISSATPSSSGTASAAVTGRPRPTPRPGAKCDPPWLIDSRGIRRYNPDCVK